MRERENYGTQKPPLGITKKPNLHKHSPPPSSSSNVPLHQRALHGTKTRKPRLSVLRSMKTLLLVRLFRKLLRQHRQPTNLSHEMRLRIQADEVRWCHPRTHDISGSVLSVQSMDLARITPGLMGTYASLIGRHRFNSTYWTMAKRQESPPKNKKSYLTKSVFSVP